MQKLHLSLINVIVIVNGNAVNPVEENLIDQAFDLLPADQFFRAKYSKIVENYPDIKQKYVMVDKRTKSVLENTDENNHDADDDLDTGRKKNATILTSLEKDIQKNLPLLQIRGQM